MNKHLTVCSLGCLIVEIRDYRDVATQDPPQTQRVVLWPNDESNYAEMLLASAQNPGSWTDLDALSFEASALVGAPSRTRPPSDSPLTLPHSIS